MKTEGNSMDTELIYRNVPMQKDKYMKDVNHYSLNQINELSGGEPEFVNQILTVFIELGRDTINGLKSALAIRDVVAIKRMSHKIKPSLRSLEVDELESDIVYLETLDESSVNVSKLNDCVHKVITIISEIIEDLTRKH